MTSICDPHLLWHIEAEHKNSRKAASILPAAASKSCLHSSIDTKHVWLGKCNIYLLYGYVEGKTKIYENFTGREEMNRCSFNVYVPRLPIEISEMWALKDVWRRMSDTISKWWNLQDCELTEEGEWCNLQASDKLCSGQCVSFLSYSWKPGVTWYMVTRDVNRARYVTY